MDQEQDEQQTGVGGSGEQPAPAEQEQQDDQVLVLESWQVALPATGDERVDAALARLVDVAGLPPAEHPDLYEAVHRDLRAALADLGQA